MNGRGDALSRPPLYSVAITGGMGAGKSRSARYLATRFGLGRIDADAVGRALIAPNGAAYDQLRNALPNDFFTAQGRIDRPRLRAAIFTDPGLRRRLEDILHPAIRAEIHRRLAGTTGPCLVEVPLLFEAGWQEDFDRVVVVYACPAQRLRRLQLRDGLDEQGARAAITAQGPDLPKLLAADHVVDNSGPWALTLLELERVAGRCGWTPVVRKKAAKPLDSTGEPPLL